MLAATVVAVEFAEREPVSAVEVAHFLAALECCNFHLSAAINIAVSQWIAVVAVVVAVAKMNWITGLAFAAKFHWLN